MYTVLLVIYLLVSLSVILLIMIQRGNSIDMGGGAYNFRGTLGGLSANGVSHFMVSLINILGIFFFVLSLLLGNISNKCHREKYNLINNNELSQLNNDTAVYHQGSGVSG